jgi:hypothetical protein
MKPKKGWLLERLLDPKHLLVNISESAMLSLHKGPDENRKGLIEKGITNMRRVYPRGTRIQSSNLDPVKFWRDGSHFAALNWQTYGRKPLLSVVCYLQTSVQTAIGRLTRPCLLARVDGSSRTNLCAKTNRRYLIVENGGLLDRFSVSVLVSALY